mgnify:CR=1 FL=1
MSARPSGSARWWFRAPCPRTPFWFGRRAGAAAGRYIDGYNILPLLTGETDKSPRKEIFYFSDDGDLTALRYDYPLSWATLFEAPVYFLLLTLLWFVWASFFDCYDLPRTAAEWLDGE